MELYHEILNRFIQEYMPYDEQQFRQFADSIVEMRCYQALLEIKAILEDDTLEDEECFTKIEEIVCVLERYGSGGGTRHDFG